MAVRIRLARAGAKNKPLYRIVAADKDRSRDGRFLEVLGTYNPKIESGVVLHKERVAYWLSKGASVSERVGYLFKTAGIV